MQRMIQKKNILREIKCFCFLTRTFSGLLYKLQALFYDDHSFLSTRSHHKLSGCLRNLKATIILFHAGCACVHPIHEYGCLVDHLFCKGVGEAANVNNAPPRHVFTQCNKHWLEPEILELESQFCLQTCCLTLSSLCNTSRPWSPFT